MPGTHLYLTSSTARMIRQLPKGGYVDKAAKRLQASRPGFVVLDTGCSGWRINRSPFGGQRVKEDYIRTFGAISRLQFRKVQTSFRRKSVTVGRHSSLPLMTGAMI